ncbi:30S ribosomal protein S5 alanine N-acetyltransferase [bacterium (Candidatus Blackallbacteria) CG17_big_fil_post_rev_8_21_14_2_50_48_46]|uniref:30S ribosomal protein S5 alanine N-acetyltransferase n=1 Tax=bacterium (Candidatus Blackallbacteria) CG17_big_fil_post_rev_8_21_14_2_50_48_46 TaxID=2014261 RepID=A0A2M7GAP7_9BACT|nr:MAG: 30S ribosomal protein S5 alanine N-acetyltransferase [bacterium (Candidatus Blackallbacteria) CG18_big_fil_WC_8_21_14_2_50_49_26]PIW19234.1 MAG: 30S ribosomal protein S5 alanine N-acetyltransferase [bacterium (Candidatus Blackallbacteria) CG17_big_fil_post_rev_8_21_14_2_50_48_46]PIW45498.1 MAG: 30S ribosomal protein S5 alanine N-acetyltransferase [bacterium (Candidatus Blackallbacteria) CG13_big_fil_rev_8_21_14_2_50_49_14]
MSLPSKIRALRIQTPRLILRPLGPEFAPQVLDYHHRNRACFKPWNPRVGTKFFTQEFHRQRLENELQESQAGRLLRLSIFEAQDQNFERVIGHLSLSNIVWGAFRSCFLGYAIDQQVQGKGYMTEALGATVELAFAHFKLHRLEANIMPRNQASIRVVEKLGFECEGLSPKYLKINGVWEDHLHYVLRNGMLE